MTVLILTSELDLSADAMVRALGRRGIPTARADLGWFPESISVTAQFESGRWCGAITTPAGAVDLHDIRAIWYRSPTSFRFPETLSTTERQHAHNEAKLGVGGVLLSLPVLWVNHPARHADAGYKPVQLSTATRCGLTVPDTLVTNEATAVQAFAQPGPIVTKMFGASAINEENGRKVAFTEIVTPDQLADLRGIHTTAHQFQRWIATKAYEARLIVIGDHVLAVAIHANSRAAHVDWRSDYQALNYDIITPPSSVAAGVINVNKQLGIRYGAYDFVVTDDDGWIFLEVNPGGQYGWLETHTGVPVTDTLADFLAAGAA